MDYPLAVLFRLDTDVDVFTVLFCLELNFVNPPLSVLLTEITMAAMDFTSAAASVQTNSAEVTQRLMAGISMETGVEPKDMKIKVNVTDGSDARPMLDEQDENITVEFVQYKETMNTDDWVEVCLQSEAPTFIRLLHRLRLLPWLSKEARSTRRA